MIYNPTIGNNNSDLTEMNRSAIVRILQQHEVCSRAEIAQMTGLTQASITKIVAVLIEMGIVSEVGEMRGKGNRRSIGLRLNAEKNKVIGIKFSRHLFAVGVFDISGKLYTQKSLEYSIELETRVVLKSMKDEVRALLEAYPDVVAIGLALPGPYLRGEGRIALVTRMQAWHNINFIEEFQNEFHKPLFIEQDANAGALAQWWFGNHGNPHTLAYLLAGEGLGSGIVERGNLLLGRQGTASELGHISIDVSGPRCECGNRGCLEMFCSTHAMLRLAQEKTPECFRIPAANRLEVCHSVFEAARHGNAGAREVVADMARFLGYGCVTLINAYNPDVIVIGDIIAEGGDLLLPTIRELVRDRTIREIYEKTRIEISTLQVDPTLYGAAAIATDRVLRKPSEYLAAKSQ